MCERLIPPGWEARLYGRQDARRYGRALALHTNEQESKLRLSEHGRPVGQWTFSGVTRWRGTAIVAG
jgi:hypothetical protein